MKKTLLTILILTALIFPAVAQEAEDESSGFGLQADIFKYVLTNSAALLNTSQSYSTNFEALDNYPLTPGDVFTLLINYGSNSERSADYITTYNIQLQQDYSMVLPFIGETNVAGKSISQLQAFISDEIARMTPVQYITFNLASPAHFNVFIYGGVSVSGYINATPVTTVIDAISMCKGFKDNASYRNVTIIRGEDEIKIDLSKFYQNADFEANPRLQPGDKIYVPMAETVVNVTGKIKYPGTYELLPDENLGTLIKLAGGVKPDAQKDRIEITRLESDGTYARKSAKLGEASATAMFNGDTVYISSLSESAETITVEGAVYGKPNTSFEPFTAPTKGLKLEVAFYPGITLLDVLDSVGGPTPYAISHRSEVRRKAEGEFISVDVNELWQTRNSALDIPLKPGDHVLVPVERTVVSVFGAMYTSDSTTSTISYVSGYRAIDYITAAGGFDEDNANMKTFTLIDLDGNRTKIGPYDEVPPGSVIYVEKNLFANVDTVIGRADSILGWALFAVTAYEAVNTLLNLYWLLDNNDETHSSFQD